VSGVSELFKPPVVVELSWDGDLRFKGKAGAAAVVLDSTSQEGPTPVQALAASLAGCMAMDVADILRKGRFDVQGIDLRLVAERPPDPPRYLKTVDLHLVVTGEVPQDRVERAIALSRERYCSVWHSLRSDIVFTTSFEVRPPRT
jgi:putative redox protein